ncbi:transporter [Pseudomonas bohemica]|uniref:transporter n=1 Tax=Pseudomonas bohemica TaxID=2044872 RepID=UPI000DA63FB9|nr:transporter [Pseudomonas bohemica]
MNRKVLSLKHAAGMLLTISGFSPLMPAHALGISLGDWVSPSPGHPIFAWHVVQTNNHKTYQDNKVVNDKARMNITSTLVRYTYPVRVADGVVANPQFGVIAASIDSNRPSGLNDTAGLSDPFFTVPFFFTLDAEHREYFVAAPFVFFPVGRYDHDQSMNTGENRWHTALQLGYQRQLVGNYNIELMGEANFFTNNDKSGPDNGSLSQDPMYQVNAAVSYMFGQRLNNLVGGGVSHRWGGESHIDGQALDDRASSTAVFMEVSSFFTAQDQVLLGISRDIVVENGFKTDAELKFRYIHVF